MKMDESKQNRILETKMKRSPLLELKDLQMYFPVKNKRFVRAVDHVDMQIFPHEIMGLVGESGSGKSTIVYTVMGLYWQTGGEVLYKGNVLPPGERSMEFKRRVQIVFQDPGSSLNPYKDVRQTLALPLRVHKIVPRHEIDKRIYEILDMVELPRSFMYKMPSYIGGGEKQLVSIARALCSDPEFIILDEPTSSLDVSIQAKIINMLIKLHKNKELTYMLITHDMSLMRNIATKVAVMYLGKICEIAPTNIFYSSPRHPYTQMLLSAIPVVSKEEEKLKPKKVLSTGEIPSPVNIPSGCSFHTRCIYKMPRCINETPELKKIEPDHWVRCHLCDKER